MMKAVQQKKTKLMADTKNFKNTVNVKLQLWNNRNSRDEDDFMIK